MAGSPLEVDVLQLKLEDLTVDQFKKLEKKLGGVKKKFQETEDQVKKTGKTVKGFGKGFRGLGGRGIGGGIGRAGRLGVGGAGGLASFGGAITSAFAGAGALVGAPLLALNAVKNRFLDSLTLKTELLTFANDFKSSFKEKADNVIAAFKRTDLITKEDFFRKEDIQKTLAGLSDIGVDPETFKDGKYAEVLEKFSKAQGLKSLEEAIAVLFGGQIKSFKGLENTEIRHIEGLRKLLANRETATSGAEYILDALSDAEGLDAAANLGGKERDDFNKIRKIRNEVKDLQQEKVKDEIASGQLDIGFESLKAFKKFDAQFYKLFNLLIDKLDDAIVKSKKYFDIEDVPDTPRSRANINNIPKKKRLPGPAGRGSKVTYPDSKPNITINVTAKSEDLAEKTAKAVQDGLDKLATDSFRTDTALEPVPAGG